jgi:hypothetical protein
MTSRDLILEQFSDQELRVELARRRRPDLLDLHAEHLRGRSLANIGMELGISRERVRQLFAERDLPHGHVVSQQRREMQRVVTAVAIAARHESKRRHGTLARYRLGCHCDECRTANARYYHELAIKKGRASTYICEECGESAWETHHGGWRHSRRANHKPIPVPRRIYAKDAA